MTVTCEFSLFDQIYGYFLTYLASGDWSPKFQVEFVNLDLSGIIFPSPSCPDKRSSPLPHSKFHRWFPVSNLGCFQGSFLSRRALRLIDPEPYA